MATVKKTAATSRKPSVLRTPSPTRAPAQTRTSAQPRATSARTSPKAPPAPGPKGLSREGKAAKRGKSPKDAKPSRSEKSARKEKLVRDSFTMPAADFGLIATVKQRALQFQHVAKKSEVLRAGLVALQGLSEAQLRAILESLPVIKTGRPRKGN